jgi:ABC-type multidrug transport system fused ATPase/permease subunit
MDIVTNFQLSCTMCSPRFRDAQVFLSRQCPRYNRLQHGSDGDSYASLALDHTLYLKHWKTSATSTNQLDYHLIQMRVRAFTHHQLARLRAWPLNFGSYVPPCHMTSTDGAVFCREVTFAYSGSKSTRPAVTNLSFSILPGQLVVIVGPNGSGKTSLVKLLTRMYEPTSGIIMVDHQPAKGFNLRQLREATAVLSQDHEYFRGLSVAENVGLGRWRKRGQMNLINDSLKLGGADGFVRKLKEGTNMVIHPLSTKRARVKHKFGKFYDQLEKEGDLSGTMTISLHSAIIN